MNPIPDQRPRSNFWVNWIVGGLVLVAAYIVINEHWAHLTPYFPFLLFLSCPLMHLFMHRGHHHHHRRESKDGQSPDRDETHS